MKFNYMITSGEIIEVAPTSKIYKNSFLTRDIAYCKYLEAKATNLLLESEGDMIKVDKLQDKILVKLNRRKAILTELESLQTNSPENCI